MTEELAGAEPCGPGRIDRGVHDGQRECQLCAMVDGAIELVDADDRAIPECAALVGAGDYVEYSTRPEDQCPDTGRILFHGDAILEAAGRAWMYCVADWCEAPSE